MQHCSNLTCWEPSRLGEIAENSDRRSLRTSAPNPVAVDSKTGEATAAPSSSENSPGEASACSMVSHRAAEKKAAQGDVRAAAQPARPLPTSAYPRPASHTQACGRILPTHRRRPLHGAPPPAVSQPSVAREAPLTGRTPLSPRGRCCWGFKPRRPLAQPIATRGGALTNQWQC